MSGENGAPSGWIWSTIAEVGSTLTGGTPSRRVPGYFDGKIPWVKSGELGDRLVTNSEESITEAAVADSSAKVFPKGTLCIALYGATVGKLGILDIDAATNQAVCGIFLPAEFSTKYLYYFLYSIRRLLIEQGKGGAQSNISNAIVRETRIPIAPLNEQHRIVAKIEELFSDLDAGVAALERAKANLKRYRASVLKAAVSGKLTQLWRAEHPDVEPASDLLKRILIERQQKWEADQLAKFKQQGKQPPKGWKEKYKEPAPPDTTGLPELPKGWSWASVEQICPIFVDCAHRTPVYADVGIPTLRPRDVVNGILRLDQAAKVDPDEFSVQTARREPEAGDIIYSRELSFGWGVIVPADTPLCMSQGMVLFRAHDEVDSRYLLLCLNGPDGRAQAKNVATGSAHPHINLGDIKNYRVPIPPIAEQSEIVAEAAEKLSQIDAAGVAIEHGLKRAARLRQAILKRAFSGQLVPQDPHDEPASVLLERIKAEREQSAANGKKPAKKPNGKQPGRTPRNPRQMKKGEG